MWGKGDVLSPRSERSSDPSATDIVPQQNVGLLGQTGSDRRTPEMTLMTQTEPRQVDFAVMHCAFR
jgi:hypothetical protein